MKAHKNSSVLSYQFFTVVRRSDMMPQNIFATLNNKYNGVRFLGGLKLDTCLDLKTHLKILKTRSFRQKMKI